MLKLLITTARLLNFGPTDQVRRHPLVGAFYETEVGGIPTRNVSFKFRNKKAKDEDSFYSNKGVAGVGWILADNWLPYQKQSFVTPPFSGFISGHSTFSRALAEVLSFVTGSKYFPGGIHASYDDLPARIIGSKIGIKAVKTADNFFRK